jgi:polysaccharide export outer membrane protein
MVLIMRPANLHTSVILPIFLLAGCASNSFSPTGGAVTLAQNLPAPDATTTAVDFSSYQMGPNDEVAIEVFGAPELKREVQIDAAGNLSLPLIGSIAAGGRRPEEVSAMIAQRLKGKYIRDPQVTVNVIKASPKMITVDGAVGAPGVYPIVGRMSLQQAIASAKGAAEIANLNQIVVFRTVNNQKMAGSFSLKAIRSGQAADPQLYANDIVVVGENATRRFLKDAGSFPILNRFLPFAW